MNFEDYLDEEVELYGIAENSRYGAIVVCGPRSVVYVDGVQEWGLADEGEAINITGIVAARGDDADLYAEGGGVKHGVGRHYILKDATWRRLAR